MDLFSDTHTHTLSLLKGLGQALLVLSMPDSPVAAYYRVPG